MQIVPADNHANKQADTRNGVPPQPFRGVFAIPPTPFDDAGNLDIPSLRRCVDFCVGAGAHGLVAPVNASESIVLTDAERLQVAAIIVEQAAGRIPVVVGVSGVSTAASILYARHATSIGASAVIAMPPYVRHPPADEIYDFYRAVAQTVAGLPVWIQDYVAPIGTPMAPSLLARMLREIPGVDYLKEETLLAPQVMTQVQAMAGTHLRGTMGGMAGRFLLEEYRRGACGTMPACEVVDAHVLVWEALERGDAAAARRLHTTLLPLLNYEAMYSFTVYKEILVRRGVISSARTRVPGAGLLDAENQREIDLLLRDLEPLLRVVSI
ncbi:dihydrodipicolinate synthase family protein [Candidatus Gracilibacteria bacterium]|nr:dihydrodipicolinate synthase family protein [Candidatus Gracilibacteria bacterium]